MALLLSYVWRWHDMSPVLYPFRIAAVATVSSWAFLLFSPRIPQLKRALASPPAKLFVLWIAWQFLIVPLAMSSDIAFAFVQDRQVKVLTMFLFFLGFMVSWTQVRILVIAHAAGAGVIAFYYAKQGFPTDFTPVRSYDRNDLAMHFAVAVPLVIFLAMQQKNVWMKRLLWALSLFVATAAIASESRGAFLAVGGMALFFLLNARGLRLRTRLLPPVLLVLGVWVAPDDVQERLSTLLEIESDYNMTKDTGRKEIWKRSLTYIADYPIAGVGLNNFGLADARLAPQFRTGSSANWGGKAAHNSFLQVAVETGLVGGVLFVLMIVTAGLRLVRVRRRFSRRPEPEAETVVQLCNAVLAALIGYCVAGFFLSQGYAAILITLVALAIGTEVNASRYVRVPDRNSRGRTSRRYRAWPRDAAPAGSAVAGPPRNRTTGGEVLPPL